MLFTAKGIFIWVSVEGGDVSELAVAAVDCF
jgi:hypothetical protein